LGWLDGVTLGSWSVLFVKISCSILTGVNLNIRT